MSSAHVLIIGGGIGGLALAQGLRNNGISFTIFERDLSALARAQGYRLRLAGAGIESLRQCLDNDMWDLFERTCSADVKFNFAQFNPVNSSYLPSQTPGGSGEDPGRGGHGFKERHTPNTGLKS